MYPTAVRSRRGVVIVAMMLLCACAAIAVPAFSAGASAVGSEDQGASVPVETDTVVIVAELDEDSTVEEVAAEYAKIQAERIALESEDKNVFIADRGMPVGDGGRAADLFRQAMGPGCFLGPEPRDGPMGPDPSGGHGQPDGHATDEPQELSMPEEGTVTVISSNEIVAEPDAGIVQEVIDMIEDSGDGELKSISSTLQSYLAWLAMWGGDDATVAVLSTERKDGSDDDEQQDGEPYVVDAEDDDDVPDDDPEPVYEPAGSPDAPETVLFYYTGVTTSGLSF